MSRVREPAGRSILIFVRPVVLSGKVKVSFVTVMVGEEDMMVIASGNRA